MSSRTPLFFCEVCTVRKGSVTGRRFQRSECSSLRARKQVTLRQLKTLVIEFENSGGEEETVSRAITRDGITPFIFRMNRSEHQAGSGGTCRKVCRTNNCDYPSIVSWVKQGHCFKISRLYCNEACLHPPIYLPHTVLYVLSYPFLCCHLSGVRYVFEFPCWCHFYRHVCIFEFANHRCASYMCYTWISQTHDKAARTVPSCAILSQPVLVLIFLPALDPHPSTRPRKVSGQSTTPRWSCPLPV